MELNPNATFEQLSEWLNQNLKDQNRIKACCQNVKNIPLKKGIYFWFLNHDSYHKLSRNMVINPIDPCYQRVINNEVYDLVYLGTAGVRNNSNGVNNGHLQERLKWHLCDNKGVSALCSGTMSTFRRTIGGLISSDLIENDTQAKIDDILCSSFYVYFIAYEGTFLEVKDTINQIESIFIYNLRPLFNLDQNPNAFNPYHITYKIDKMRKKVQTHSKNKWCNKTKVETKNYSNPLKTNNSILISDKHDGCVEFKVLQNQSIAVIADATPNLPVGICTIEIINPVKGQNLYIRNNGNPIRTIRTRFRTVSEYFNAPDTAVGLYKWQVVQNEMINKGIEEIIVRVCPIN